MSGFKKNNKFYSWARGFVRVWAWEGDGSGMDRYLEVLTLNLKVVLIIDVLIVWELWGGWG